MIDTSNQDATRIQLGDHDAHTLVLIRVANEAIVPDQEGDGPSGIAEKAMMVVRPA